MNLGILVVVFDETLFERSQKTFYSVVFVVISLLEGPLQNEITFGRVVSQSTSTFPGPEENDNAET